MRILVSTSTFPLQQNDSLPRFVFDLAVGLSAGGEVTALVPGAAGYPQRERMGVVDVERFTYFLPRRLQALAYGHGMRDNFRGSWAAKLQPLPFLLAQALATRSVVRSKGVTVVNSHWLVPQGLSTALARGRQESFHHILSVHAADVYLLRKLPFGRALARFVLSRTDVVFADGSHVRDSLDELIGRPSGAQLQPNGVWVDVFRGHQDMEPVEVPFKEGYLLFFGRFAEKKGITYLLKALPRVREKYPGLGLFLIGYGALESQIREEVASLGVADRVHFLGRQPHSEIVRYLKACRAAVIPSIIDQHGETEGMPTVVLEAMASGTRVIGTAVDGIPDVLRHQDNGWLCREKDAEDLAEKIIMALEDPRADTIVESALATADRFDWSCVAGRYVETIRGLEAGRSAVARDNARDERRSQIEADE
ncbi:MAG: glycosyltransferase [Deltaproteobacteria bacterium]|nr:glycosyltransferase [Deltaproteobacteria bacterium]